VPSYTWIQDGAKDIKKASFIWYAEPIAKVDPVASEIQFMSERRKVPNAYIVPIPKGQRAKKGDIVLTWWQSGSGMKRAIVVDDAEPTSPVVVYIGISWDNPAKSPDGSTTIGQMDEKIAPDTFVKLTTGAPGSMVAYERDGSLAPGELIRAQGDDLLVSYGIGHLEVVPRSKATLVPVDTVVSVGAKVRALWGTFADGTVKSVDRRNGRVTIDFGSTLGEAVKSFAEILP
jgi:hypothetical protein